MEGKRLKIQLETLDNWEVAPDPYQKQGISKKIEELDTENFFSNNKKKWFLLWSTLLILIIFIALKLLLNISLIDFLKQLSSVSHVPYFLATLLFGFLTFFVCEICIRVLIIKQKLGVKLRNVSKFEWFSFSIISFFIQSITPFSIGSEPYNIWWLNKKGISIKEAAAATVVSSICWFIGQFLITWPAFIYLTVQNWEKISSLKITTSYWLVLTGLLVDIVVSTFIFVVSYVNKAHFFISSFMNEIKRYFGFQYLTRDELFQKYLRESSFQKIYIQFLFNKTTIWIILLYLTSNVWYYILFSFSHRLFLYSVGSDNKNYWDPATSTLVSFNLINVATTSNNFLPLPSSEGSLQAVLQKLMKDMFVLPGADSGATLSDDQLSKINDSTIFLWRFFSKYLGLLIAFIFILIIGFNPKPRKAYQYQLNEKLNKIRNYQRNPQNSHELVF